MPKLPAPREEDLAKGILETIDMESYGVEKQATVRTALTDATDTLLKTRLKALKNERAEVNLLLESPKCCESQGPDAKAEALLDWICRLQAEQVKVVVFNEFVPTQEMLHEFLTERGFEMVCLNGSISIPTRWKEVFEPSLAA